MTHAVALVRLLPLAFLGRLGIAFVEIVLACLFLSTSVVVGHDLKAWRAWYWDPSTLRYWAPTPAPTDAAVLAVAPTLTPAPTSTPAVPTAAPTPTPACRTSGNGSVLVFMRPFVNGADCIWLSQRTDGWHVDVDNRGTHTDLGMISLSTPRFDVYSPASAADPICVVTGDAGAQWANGLVFALQQRGPLLLLSTGGRFVSVHAGSDGWPWVEAVRPEGSAERMHRYFWSGTSYVER